MPNINVIKPMEYEKVSKLITKIIDVENDVNTVIQLKRLLQKKGIVNFFINLEEQNLSTDVLEKLKAVKLFLPELDLLTVKQGVR